MDMLKGLVVDSPTAAAAMATYHATQFLELAAGPVETNELIWCAAVDKATATAGRGANAVC